MVGFIQSMFFDKTPGNGSEMSGFEIYVADEEQYEEVFVEIEYHNVALCRLIYEQGQSCVVFFEAVDGQWCFEMDAFFEVLHRAKLVFEKTHGLDN